MINLGLVGWNGKKNIGDDVMTSVIIQHFYKKYKEKLNIHFFSSNIKSVKYLKTSKNLIMRETILYSFFSRKFLKRIGFHYILPSIFSRKKDIILFGGGSIIHRKGTSLTQLKIINSAKRNNKKIIIGAIGISVGPFKTSEEFELAKLIFSKMNFVVVRDKRSLDLLDQMKLNIPYEKAPDLAFLLPSYSGLTIKKNSNTKKIVGLSLRANHITKSLYSKYGEVINQWLSKDKCHEVKIFCFSELKGQDDYIASLNLLKYIEDKHHKKITFIRYSLIPVNFYKEIMECGIMISMRLHAAIIAYSVNTIPLIEPYHQKCLDLTKEINLPPDHILSNKTVDEIMSLIENSLNEKYYFDSSFVNKSQNNFQFLL